MDQRRQYDRGGSSRRPERRSDRRPERKRRKKDHKVRKVILTILLIVLITGAILLCMSAMYLKNVIIPQAGLDMEDYTANLTTTMYYQDPNSPKHIEMQTLFGEENRVWVGLEEIPENLIKATIAIEDKRFYDHHGVDWVRTCKGILNMFTGKKIVGGSTLTQQLIKNMTTDDEVTVKRKVMEIFRALELEKNYTKEAILEWYLNYIYLGQGCNGVYTASYKYFGKHISELSLAECASLIGITNNPSKYDPLGKLEVTDPETGEVKTSEDFNKDRQVSILNAMCEQKMISEGERDVAIAEPLDFSQGRDTEKNSRIYTWYQDAVINQVLDDLQTTYNWSREFAKTKLYAGGLEIYTCMNPDVQAAVDAVYGDINNLNYTSAAGQKLQSAITVIDNETGEVVAMAGGMGPKTTSLTWNRATDSLRPPGSSIKPLAVYAPAIELGIVTPSSTEEDSYFNPEDKWPVNASGTFSGTVSIAYAVEQSINTVAVKTLDKVGCKTSFEFMRDRFHIQLVESRNIGGKTFSDIGHAQLALGGLTDGVSTFDMAAAYSVFPRQGTYINPRLYTMVLDNDGNVLLQNDQKKEENALSQRTCYYMTNMLKQVVARGTGRAANFSGQEIAGKTGTTTSRKDLWFVGYTPYYTAAVWTGYDQQERLATGLKNPSTVMFKQVMSKIHAGLAYKDFDKPDTSGMKSVTYCSVSGMLPTSACAGHLVTGSFFPEDVPKGTCTIHTAKPPEPEEPDEEDPGEENPGNTTNPGTNPGGNNGGTTTPDPPPVTPDPPPDVPTPDPPPDTGTE